MAVGLPCLAAHCRVAILMHSHTCVVLPAATNLHAVCRSMVMSRISCACWGWKVPHAAVFVDNIAEAAAVLSGSGMKCVTHVQTSLTKRASTTPQLWAAFVLLE